MDQTGFAAAPLRDEGLLESAIMRPRMAAYYEDADLVRQCVLLATGIAQAQAFIDGNKRTALAAADVFLELNGLSFTGDYLAWAREIEALGARAGTLEEAADRFESWLRERVAPSASTGPG